MLCEICWLVRGERPQFNAVVRERQEELRYYICGWETIQHYWGGQSTGHRTSIHIKPGIKTDWSCPLKTAMKFLALALQIMAYSKTA